MVKWLVLITVERMKADIDTTVNVLPNLPSLIWEEERIPEDWCKGLIVQLKEPESNAQRCKR